MVAVDRDGAASDRLSGGARVLGQGTDGAEVLRVTEQAHEGTFGR